MNRILDSNEFRFDLENNKIFLIGVYPKKSEILSIVNVEENNILYIYSCDDNKIVYDEDSRIITFEEKLDRAVRYNLQIVIYDRKYIQNDVKELLNKIDELTSSIKVNTLVDSIDDNNGIIIIDPING